MCHLSHVTCNLFIVDCTVQCTLYGPKAVFVTIFIAMLLVVVVVVVVVDEVEKERRKGKEGEGN